MDSTDKKNPTRSRSRSEVENDEMTLPNSRLVVSYSTRYYQFVDDDVPAVMPDQRIDPDWEAFRAGRDRDAARSAPSGSAGHLPARGGAFDHQPQHQRNLPEEGRLGEGKQLLFVLRQQEAGEAHDHVSDAVDDEPDAQKARQEARTVHQDPQR